MADWKYKLDISDIWNKIDDDDNESIIEAGKQIAKRIRESEFFVEQVELESMAYDFENCPVDQESFNECMAQLYDWGDMNLDTQKIYELLAKSERGKLQKKMCWIKTTI
jgi:uncharacterized protein YaeQ